MKRFITGATAALALVALSASAVLAEPPVPAKGHGEAVSDVARAADYVSGRARGEAVSALAKQHGALVSAAAKAHGASAAAAGQAKGAEASESGRLKAEANTPAAN